MTGPEVPEEAFAVALGSLPGVGPSRWRELLRPERPSAAWELVVRGRHPADPGGEWKAAAARLDVGRLWRRHAAAGVHVLLASHPAYPPALWQDEESPPVLFVLGDPVHLAQRPAVALVGTRSATRYGVGVAAQLGAELAGAGVAVVSGLALGIDGAAHEGACAAVAAEPDSAARPVAVVAGGLDEPYPRRHAGLWRRVADCGAVVSECPIGTGNQTWRFPYRNRLLAALSSLVAVVECHERGGSLHTVTAAIRRGVAVGAVPGSVRSPASAGTNALLADGAIPIRDSSDVLVALSLQGEVPGQGGRPPTGPPTGKDAAAVAARVAAGHRVEHGPHERGEGRLHGRTGGGHPGCAPADPGERAVLGALDLEPATLEDVMRRTGLELAGVSVALEALSGRGLAEDLGGGWWCRVG